MFFVGSVDLQSNLIYLRCAWLQNWNFENNLAIFLVFQYRIWFNILSNLFIPRNYIHPSNLFFSENCWTKNTLAFNLNNLQWKFYRKSVTKHSRNLRNKFSFTFLLLRKNRALLTGKMTLTEYTENTAQYNLDFQLPEEFGPLKILALEKLGFSTCKLASPFLPCTAPCALEKFVILPLHKPGWIILAPHKFWPPLSKNFAPLNSYPEIILLHNFSYLQYWVCHSLEKITLPSIWCVFFLSNKPFSFIYIFH